MRVTCCQLDIAWEDKPANFERVERLLATHRLEPGSLLILPEMFSTGFSMNVSGIAEGSIGAAEQFLARTSRRHGVLTLGGVVQRDADGHGLNQALLLGPDGRELARYDKLHPFSFGQETRHYSRGQSLALAPTGEFVSAMFVCYDLRFPEVFRAATHARAQAMIVIANWPEARAAHWPVLLAARAIENQAYVMGVNRCGADPHQKYLGRSMIVDPHGRVLADAGESPGLITAELNLQSLLDYRREFPALRDVHPRYAPADPA